MATMRLVPSSYEISNTSITVTDAANAYNNTDNTTYARFGTTSTSSRYVYYRGFNFGSLPTGAVVSSFTIKYKAYESTMSTSSSYRPRIVNGTTTLTGSSTAITTSTVTNSFTGVTGSWDTISGYGSDFGIRFTVRRSGNSGTGYLYLYGCEIEVTYTVPNPRTITTTLNGDGTISPSGDTTSYDGEEFELTITPSNLSNTVTVTNNGVDVTTDLVEHYSGGTSTSVSKASESGVTTGFNRSGSAFYQSSSTSSDSWLRYAIGHTAESPYSTSNTSNTYVKDGTNDAQTMGWMNYPFDFSSLPDDAEVTSIEVKCYGATESTSETARHADVALYCGSELKSVSQSFTSTSNGTITISQPGEWDREELQDAWLRFTVGYYGGRLLGITWKVNYTTGGTLHHYTYSYEVNGDALIAVTIGTPVSQPTIYFKDGNTWVAAKSVYKKVNGSWVLQGNLANVFENGVNYVKGGS